MKSARRIGAPRYNHDWNCCGSSGRPQLLDELTTAQDPHHQVGDDNIRYGIRVDDFERGFTVIGLHDRMAGRLEGQAQKVAGIRVVIHYEDCAQERIESPNDGAMDAVWTGITPRRCAGTSNKISNFSSPDRRTECY